jgi:hypothetical protein
MNPRSSEAVSGAARSRGCLGQVSGRESVKNRQRDNVLWLRYSRGGGLMDYKRLEGSRSQSQEESVCVKDLPAAQVLALIYVTSYEDQINSAGNCL